MDEFSRITFAGYERILFLGYDYSWRPDGNYYAWTDPKPKRFYMNHRLLRDVNGDLVYSSENLIFSARWLNQYIQSFNMDAVNCGKRGLLECPQGDLSEQLSSINPAQIKKVRIALDVVSHTQAAAQAAMENFKLARGGLYHGSR